MNNCFWPAEIARFSVTSVSKPFGKSQIKSYIPQVLHTSISFSSSISLRLYIKLFFTVSSKSQVSCSTIPKRLWISSRLSSEISTPSIKIRPLLTSKKRIKRLTSVVFPAPVLPTIATF